jgi:hypothetical protein
VVLETYGEAARELDLSQDAAQKMLDKVAPALEQRALEQQAAARTEWLEQARGDSEFGGDKFDANLALAKKALDAFGDATLVELLNTSGLGDHPGMFRMLVKVAQAISEDNFVPGGTPPPEKKSHAAVLFGEHQQT